MFPKHLGNRLPRAQAAHSKLGQLICSRKTRPRHDVQRHLHFPHNRFDRSDFTESGNKNSIGAGITISVVAVTGSKVRIGIDAPREVPVLRAELNDFLEVESPESARLSRADHEGFK